MKQFVTLTISLCLSLSCYAEKVKIIKLKKQQPFKISSYYIVNVFDERNDTTNIGYIHNILGKKVTANLEGGAAAFINNFVTSNVVQNTTGTPISIHITRFELTEGNNGMRERAELHFTLALYTDNKKLIEYSGTPYAEALDPTPYLPTIIGDALQSSMEQFDNWMKSNNITTQSLSTLTVEAEMGTNTEDTGLITYIPGHPLQIKDFLSEPDDLSLAGGITYSSIRLTYTSQTTNGLPTLKITVYPTFYRERSWLRKTSKNSYALAHEQLHFDITAIKACELLHAIKAYKFSAANYAKEIEQLQKQYDKEWEQEEKDYDKETNHSLIKDKQLKWQANIKKRLSELNCYR